MFLPNDVLEYSAAPPHAIRILWIDAGQSTAYVFELRRTSALPRPVALATLAADVAARRARLLLVDPYAAKEPGAAAEKHRRLQARAWSAVGSLQAHRPALYRQPERAALVEACAREHGMSKASILRYLRRYWERGQTPDALWPDYVNSGAAGKVRMSSAGVKRGRPRKDAHAGANADDAMRAIFRAAAARHAATHDEFSRRAAYRQMLVDYFSAIAVGAVPSFGQFSYWLERDGLPTGSHGGA